MDKVFEYGKKLLDENPDIVKNRILFTFDLESNIDNIFSIYGLENYEKKLLTEILNQVLKWVGIKMT